MSNNDLTIRGMFNVDITGEVMVMAQPIFVVLQLPMSTNNAYARPAMTQSAMSSGSTAAIFVRRSIVSYHLHLSAACQAKDSCCPSSTS